ncbi:protein white-like isoform X1 [Littorina saxatilis]|uniref:ABC transporter domain-containing protein n=1 Tax=Littorina saxatilis TaxID=31220 RepID=A0AAN9BTU8_9CAEN
MDRPNSYGSRHNPEMEETQFHANRPNSGSQPQHYYNSGGSLGDLQIYSPEREYNAARQNGMDSQASFSRKSAKGDRGVSRDHVIKVATIADPNHDHQPVTLSWEGVSVFVKDKQKKMSKIVDAEEQGNRHQVPVKNGRKRIVHGVSGVVQPGTLLAIMGASGAGKSTLMNVLANRNLKDYSIEGHIKVNGLSVSNGIRNISAYVQQDDLFFGTLTVRETLTFRAQLGMDQRVKKEARLQRVEEVIQELGLTKCSDTQIGQAGTKKGISGGEAKRLSFACEMLTNPRLMFCDEPTSGLDTFMAQNVVQTLKNMAQKNRTILCTIHQPSSEIFAMFDRVLLLAEGRVAFLGASSAAQEFLRGLNYRCPVNFNPADFFILTLAIVPGKETECRQKVNTICDAFSETAEAKDIQQTITELNAHAEENSAIVEEAFANSARNEANWGRQFAILLWRSWVSLFRDVVLFRVRVMQTLVMGLVLGLIYLRLEYDQKGVQNINGGMFLLLMQATFVNMFAVVNSFPAEMGIFMREYGSGLYRTDAYFLAKSFAELPTFVVLAFVFITIDYWMMGLYETWQAYLIAAGIIIIVTNIAVSFGLLVSTIAGNVNLALAIAPPLLIPLLMFGGFFLNDESVPVYFVWLKYLSWFKYANELMSVNQWKNVDSITCRDIATKCRYTSGQDVLTSISYSEDNTYQNVGCLFALLIGLRVLSFIFLLIRARLSKS